jgi:hypothetical protein
MVLSMAARRKKELVDAGVRTARPCTRCLDALARGELTEGNPGCIVSINAELWEDWSETETFALRCQHCNNLGQDCFGVSTLAEFVPHWH